MLIDGRDAATAVLALAKALRKARRRWRGARSSYERECKERSAAEHQLAEEKRRNVQLVGECARLRGHFVSADLEAPVPGSPSVAETNNMLYVGHSQQYPVAICKGDSAFVIGNNVLAAMRAAGMQ